VAGGNISLDADKVISAPGRLHISGDELLYVLNKAGVVIGKEWGGNGTLKVQGSIIAEGGDIRAPGRLHISGEELLYVLNKSGMVVGKEWGGTGDLTVQGRIGSGGWPCTPRNGGWGGGLRTWDVEAEGSIWTAHDLIVDGSIRVKGSVKAGSSKWGFVADQFINAFGDVVERGDVVVVGDNQASRYYGLNDSIPIPEVDLASRAYDTRVCGVVSELYEPEPGSEATKVGPGQAGGMVTLGAFVACKVDADIAPIKVGDLLTTSPTKGHAQKVLDRERATGAILGKALGSLDKGRGTIPILVTLH
jgi:hypothetical protein